MGPTGPAGSNGSQGIQGPVGPAGSYSYISQSTNTITISSDYFYIPNLPQLNNSITNLPSGYWAVCWNQGYGQLYRCNS